MLPFLMGPDLHPRLKKPIGQRLAIGAMGVAYGSPRATIGPVIAGCSYSNSSGLDESNDDTKLVVQKLVVTFNVSQMKGSMLVVQPYNLSHPVQSAFNVLVNSTDLNPGTGTWVPVNIAKSPTDQFAVEVDLSPLLGARPQAIRYAWGGNDPRASRIDPGHDNNVPNAADVDCCQGLRSPSNKFECIPGLCPIKNDDSRGPFGGLPAVPFLAKLEGGKCHCPPPQDCSA
jgi:hypothetical protein